MKACVLLFTFLSLALSAPTNSQHREEKRQGILGSLLSAIAGVFGVSATFDYVIVGGGTAGLALANRLSVNQNLKIAVVEAGTLYEITDPLLSTSPGGDVIFVGSDPSDNNPLVDWSFVTQPQAGANDRQIHYARGKCLGGR